MNWNLNSKNPKVKQNLKKSYLGNLTKVTQKTFVLLNSVLLVGSTVQKKYDWLEWYGIWTQNFRGLLSFLLNYYFFCRGYRCDLLKNVKYSSTNYAAFVLFLRNQYATNQVKMRGSFVVFMTGSQWHDFLILFGWWSSIAF